MTKSETGFLIGARLIVMGMTLGCLSGISACAVAAGEFPEATNLAGQTDESRPGNVIPFEYLGPGKCSLCHTRKEELSEFLSTAFCALDEYSIWAEHDVHRHSFELMTGTLGQQMALKLGWKPEELAGKQECLSCHVGLQTRIPGLDSAEISPAEKRFHAAGVSCEACHGPSSSWINDHWRTTEWRKVSPTEKLTKHAFTPLRSSVEKSRLCFSCHVGDPDRNRVVTHAMYAAGHPPLPGIEITAYEDSMPSHWRSVREKPDFEHREVFVRENLGVSVDASLEDLPRFRATVVSGLMAYRQSLELLAGTAARSEESGPYSWPELAVFDCQACHHALRRPSIRLELGYGQRIPGRPTEFQWPSALLEIGLSRLPEDAGVREQLNLRRERLIKSLNRQPFGRPEDLVRIISGSDGGGDDDGESLLRGIDRCVAAVAGSRFDRKQAREILARLLVASPDSYPDYHSARQLAWAIESLVVELEVGYPAPIGVESGPMATPSEKINKDLELFRGFRERRVARRKLAREEWSIIDLNLLTDTAESALADQLPIGLDAARNYDPFEFRDHLQEFAKRYARLTEASAE